MAITQFLMNYALTSPVTITMNGLAHAAARESTLVDNSANKYRDYSAIVTISTLTNPGLGIDKAVYIYPYGSPDKTNCDYICTGTDAAITLGTHNLPGPYVCSLQAVGTLHTWVIGSVAQFFGGNIPQYFGFVVHNMASATFLGSDCTLSVQGLYDSAS